ncbi:hypothetical protein KGY77_08100, partial [Candidatus Bipolaricaulota bacterium]|nr:hypothetical protein [Candidatus Bipolaricaulota bacterium]
MTDRISVLFILFSTTLLIVGGGSFTRFETRKNTTSRGVPIVAEELKCHSYSLKKLSFPTKELSEWKTFRSEEHGFEFRYPPAGQVDTYSAKEGKKVRVDLLITGETLLQEKFFLVKVEKTSDGKPVSPPGEGP